jgi:hypothetical protein
LVLRRFQQQFFRAGCSRGIFAGRNWLANIVYMGKPEELEYKIAMPNGALRLAVTYIRATAELGFRREALAVWSIRRWLPASVMLIAWMT